MEIFLCCPTNSNVKTLHLWQTVCAEKAKSVFQSTQKLILTSWLKLEHPREDSSGKFIMIEGRDLSQDCKITLLIEGQVLNMFHLKWDNISFNYIIAGNFVCCPVSPLMEGHNDCPNFRLEMASLEKNFFFKWSITACLCLYLLITLEGHKSFTINGLP